ncbi:hypothetical protein M0L39_RS09610 [Providencia rettgeri]|nr:hypothetical protein [Providencia rettgeri]EJD6600197.1 hypothetical protein [Providencia rettgeri]
MPKSLKLSDEQLRQISASVLASVKSKSIVTSANGEASCKHVGNDTTSVVDSKNFKSGSTDITSKQATKIFVDAFKKVVSSK